MRFPNNAVKFRLGKIPTRNFSCGYNYLPNPHYLPDLVLVASFFPGPN